MTTTFSENENNDIYLGSDGNLAIATGVEAVKFICQAVIEAQKGEMLLDTTEGMPNFDLLWQIGVPKLGQYRAALFDKLSNVDGVKLIKSLSISSNNNVLSYSAIIETEFGEMALNG